VENMDKSTRPGTLVHIGNPQPQGEQVWFKSKLINQNEGGVNGKGRERGEKKGHLPRKNCGRNTRLEHGHLFSKKSP